MTVGELKKIYHNKCEVFDTAKGLLKKKCGISITKLRKIDVFNARFKV